MKKVIIIGVNLAVFILCLVSTASTESYIGILLNGYQKQCTVHHKGEEYDCAEARHLYVGDKVIKKPDIKALTIKWAPYAHGKILDKTSMTVVFEPPTDRKLIVQDVKAFLSFITTSHGAFAGASSGKAMTRLKKISLQPYNNATLISGLKTTFAWPDSHDGYVMCKDSGGREIFRMALGSEKFIELTPEQIGMRPGEIYTCSMYVIGDSRQFTLRLLPTDIAQQVIIDLGQIEKESLTDNDQLIQKALYLQFASDTYPQDTDLYWLSYMRLEKIKDDKMLYDDDRILLDILRESYLRHAKDAAEITP